MPGDRDNPPFGRLAHQSLGFEIQEGGSVADHHALLGGEHSQRLQTGLAKRDLGNSIKHGEIVTEEARSVDHFRLARFPGREPSGASRPSIVWSNTSNG